MAVWYVRRDWRIRPPSNYYAHAGGRIYRQNSSNTVCVYSRSHAGVFIQAVHNEKQALTLAAAQISRPLKGR
ncbi:hypothetical protein GCM10010211_17880 [Streptomyces albospinus]|uniref:DUF397 domain-containing protein n=1 Tax=Streptomyces albospinus TaxID=285515 RepID=A0ABQ2UVU1_9ACTN|nr:hypothetical protein GCM10010211_17880 [Streptomyces albospinus]